MEPLEQDRIRRPDTSRNFATFTPEVVAYWFFRLNGCMTIADFTLHPARKSSGSSMSDVDVAAVRFPFRIELEDAHIGPMIDHNLFMEAANSGRIFVALCEVKKGHAAFNDPWIRDDAVITKTLHRLGMFEYDRVAPIASALRATGKFEDSGFIVHLVIACGIPSERLSQSKAPQLTWSGEILPFIYRRLTKYRAHKSHIDTWSVDGKRLFKVAINAPSEEHFVESVINGFIATASPPAIDNTESTP